MQEMIVDKYYVVDFDSGLSKFTTLAVQHEDGGYSILGSDEIYTDENITKKKEIILDPLNKSYILLEEFGENTYYISISKNLDKLVKKKSALEKLGISRYRIEEVEEL